jgi:hypothetical protein
MNRVALMILAAAIAGCSVVQGDPYPLPKGPSLAWVTAPAGIGEPVQNAVLFLDARPGDSIELLSAEPIGLASGAAVKFYFSPPIQEPDGDTVVGERLEPLAHAVFSNDGTSISPANTVGIVAEITANQAGRYQLDAVRLTYRLNGGAEQVGTGIDAVFIVCAADPKPDECVQEDNPALQ